MRKASSKRPKKKREDEAQAAVRVIAAIAAKSEEPDAPMEITDEMRAAAAAFGRIGGKIGGVRRAETLTAKRRSEIATAAAQARWKKPANRKN